jgi:signal transduction histidine kinase
MMSAIEAPDLSDRLAWSGPDDEIGRLCTTFDRLLDRLEAAFERERRFTANASHELRTPLAVMRAEIELTLGRARDDATYRATLRRLQRETNRLEVLVESLLLTARSDAGLASANAHPLRDVAERAVARVSPIAAERDIALGVRTEHDLWALVEVALLESALVAVLDNALRYTPAGRPITVVVGRHAEDALLSIVDGGSGFSPEALQRATQRFWRDDASRSSAGMGLGLAIVAAIVERHRGSIAVRNDDGGGGIVEIRLPVVAPRQECAKSGVIGSTVASSA